MAGGITDWISFRFDDAAAEPAVIGIVDHYFANQVARQLHTIRRQFRSPETPQTTNGIHLSVR
jgi:hypothetical protein